MDACKKIKFSTPAEIAGRVLSLILLYIGFIAAVAISG